MTFFWQWKKRALAAEEKLVNVAHANDRLKDLLEAEAARSETYLAEKNQLVSQVRRMSQRF